MSTGEGVMEHVGEGSQEKVVLGRLIALSWEEIVKNSGRASWFESAGISNGNRNW